MEGRRILVVLGVFITLLMATTLGNSLIRLLMLCGFELYSHCSPIPYHSYRPSLPNCFTPPLKATPLDAYQHTRRPHHSLDQLVTLHLMTTTQRGNFHCLAQPTPQT